ncbi:AurF N-oxygenase family protein [Nocardioides limicola]|uniref:AurF N-oxygenase family protein n=1 Tax=Nocardioides limicola TaxID=2803368 RepID=UPI00193B7030|nr:diiron oxygenase [Nocardioides sp. DJM-14]
MTMTVGEHPQSYEETLQTLSEASVHQHFDAFLDVPWDDPEYAVDVNDPRWVLPKVDTLGATEWYQSLPRERQIAIGIYRQANVVKVGLQFEQILIAGLMHHAFKLPNNRPEFRYSTHEATEECHHTQMFQEFVNRSGQNVPGGPRWFLRVAPLMPLAAGAWPFIFFIGVLGGEEPIDHVQKNMLRSDAQLHPLLQRIMQIHIAEEARHIGFAHQYIEHRAPRLNRRQRAVVSVVSPIVLRLLVDAIAVPNRQALREMGVPRKVARQVWWRSEESQKLLRDMLGDVRMLMENADLMNPVARRVWRLMGIDGRPSRFRSEPTPAAA